MLLVSYNQQYFNTSITVLTNQVWKLLIALFKVSKVETYWCSYGMQVSKLLLEQAQLCNILVLNEKCNIIMAQWLLHIWTSENTIIIFQFLRAYSLKHVKDLN